MKFYEKQNQLGQSIHRASEPNNSQVDLLQTYMLYDNELLGKH